MNSDFTANSPDSSPPDFPEDQMIISTPEEEFQKLIAAVKTYLPRKGIEQVA